MIKKAVLMILIALFSVCLLGCVDNSYPIYERTDTEEDGITVNFEGVTYKMYPLLKWEARPDGNMIGYAGSKKTIICFAEGDTERNFLYLQDNGASMYYKPLYRTDRVIPEPSEDTVDSLRWSEYDFTGEDKQNISNSVMETEIIKKLFSVLESGEKIWEYKMLTDFRVHIYCASGEVPGASYDLMLVKNNNKLLIGNTMIGYNEVPTELIEDIAGHEIDIEAMLS